MKKLNVVFAGTPAFGLPVLEAIAQSGHHLAAVYTQPDRPAGRGRKLMPSAVKSWAVEREIPVFQPEQLKTPEEQQRLASLKPDVMIVVAYGLLLPQAVLDIPSYGCINVHASILPRWRGASPIQQAILHGDEISGVTIMKMDAGLDTGDSLSIARCQLSSDETAATLHDKLSMMAAEPLIDCLNSIEACLAGAQKQDNTQATLAPKIKKEEAQLDWQQPALLLERQVRAFNPWPIAFFILGDERVRVYQARVIETKKPAKPGTVTAISPEGIQVAASDKSLLIEILQFPGKKPLKVADWLNAHQSQIKINDCLQ